MLLETNKKTRIAEFTPSPISNNRKIETYQNHIVRNNSLTFHTRAQSGDMRVHFSVAICQLKTQEIPLYP